MSKKPAYTFTAADRARASESRAKNKARKERAWLIAEGEEEIASWDVLNTLYAIALDGEQKTSLRVRASAVVLPYLMAKIKAKDGSEGIGLDPINVNLLETAANEERHGKVDPAQWSAADVPADPPAETPLPEDDRPALPKVPKGVIHE